MCDDFIGRFVTGYVVYSDRSYIVSKTKM